MKAYVSSTIANFRDKLWQKYPRYRVGWDCLSPALFFGIYSPRDARRYFFHLGPKTAVWCGADILRLTRRRAWFVRGGRHVCENEVEQAALRKRGINAEVRPLFFGQADAYTESYVPSDTPHVFLSAHPGREREYGVDLVEQIAPEFPHITFHVYGITGTDRENVRYHGHVREEFFDAETSAMQAGIRLNTFDGCSEVMAKALLRGQYAFSVIPYYGVPSNNLRGFLKELPTMKEPNPYSNIWRFIFSLPL